MLYDDKQHSMRFVVWRFTDYQNAFSLFSWTCTYHRGIVRLKNLSVRPEVLRKYKGMMMMNIQMRDKNLLYSLHDWFYNQLYPYFVFHLSHSVDWYYTVCQTKNKTDKKIIIKIKHDLKIKAFWMQFVYSCFFLYQLFYCPNIGHSRFSFTENGSALPTPQW